MTLAEFNSHSVADTIACASRIARVLQAGDVLAISGDLGAGKTHFCKGIAIGLGIDPDLVNSPTFVLLQQYAGRLSVYHFDTYRLSDAGEFEDMGGVELLEHDGVCLIEWPERIEELLPSRTVRTEIVATDAESRSIRIVRDGQRASAVADAAVRDQ